MHNSKLVRLLKSLSTSEIREFKDFVSSPFFNKNDKIILLFNIVKKYYPQFDQPEFSSEKVFAKIYSNENYDYFKLKNLSSDLFGLAKEFLSFSNYRKYSDLKQRQLLTELRNRNLDKIFEQTFKKAEKELMSVKVLDENYFFRKLGLTEEKLFFTIPRNPDSRIDFYQDELDNFLMYSIIRLLKLYNIMQLEIAQSSSQLNLWMFDEVMNYIKNKKDIDNPTLLIYYNIILLTTKKDEKYFFILKNLFEEHFDNLDPESRYTFFLHMHNFCAYNYNVKCNTNFLKEQFLLTKYNYERKNIFLGKVLYPDFLNHVKIAVRVDEFEWAENFINEFSHLLNEEKENTLNFCYAYINYKKGRSDEAMEYLSRTNFPIFIMKVQVKILLLQINYEKGYYEQANAMIDAFRHFLSRENTLAESSKKHYYDFLKVLNEFIKFRSGIRKSGSDFIIDRLRESVDKILFNQFGIKLWLKEKLNEIDKKKKFK